MNYEFLTYEMFPEDPYICEIVEVLVGGCIILPYQHIRMKDGGKFWSWCGCAATKDGVKKRFNAEFDSKSMKRKFESDLEAFIAKKAGYPLSSHQPPKENPIQVQQTSNSSILNQGVQSGSDQLPF